MNVSGYEIKIPEQYESLASEYNTEWSQTGKALEISKFLSVVKNKKTLIDIGGFYGFVSMLFCAAEENRKSFCFEPNMNFIHGFIDIANENEEVKYFDDIIMYPFFVGDKDEDIAAVQTQGVGMLSVVDDDSKNSSLFPNMDGFDYEYEKSRGLCKSVMLDTFMYHLLTEQQTIPDVLKIDVEGYERKVLTGAEKTIRNFRPYIFLEVHGRHITAYGSTPNEVFEHLKELKYEVHNIEGDSIQSLNEYESFFETKTENHFYCIPKEQL